MPVSGYELRRLRATVAWIAEHPDLPDHLRDELIERTTDDKTGLGRTADGQLALSARALAPLIGLSGGNDGVGTLRKWRERGVGPGYVSVRRGKRMVPLYPVAAVMTWLHDLHDECGGLDERGREELGLSEAA